MKINLQANSLKGAATPQRRSRPAWKLKAEEETCLMAHSSLRDACKLEAEEFFSRKKLVILFGEHWTCNRFKPEQKIV